MSTFENKLKVVQVNYSSSIVLVLLKKRYLDIKTKKHNMTGEKLDSILKKAKEPL